MRNITRRDLLVRGAAAAAALPFAGRLAAAAPIKGNIKQSASKWCYGGVDLDRLCSEGKAFGLQGVDLLRPGKDFETVKKHGLVCTMTSCNGIGNGFNRPENHDGLIKNLIPAIDATAAAGFPNVIVFSGNNKGMAKDVGLKNCAEGLKKIVGHAEKKKVCLCMEYLNSKSHKDYMCDDSKWAFDLVKAVGSPNFKILYDIFHVAMMEAKQVEVDGKKVAQHNIIELIQKNIDCIGHFHTGGFPGRKDIDETQLLDYPPIMRAIVESGYKGYVAHEFVPKGKKPEQKLAALKKAIQICDV
ncbi:sugar phosphate isomerase/epimerase [bacterium]|nr:sugar phosphate isomerase/epimerase [bacterium]